MIVSYDMAIKIWHSEDFFYFLLFEQESKPYPIGGSSVLLRLTASCKVCSSVFDAVLYYS